MSPVRRSGLSRPTRLMVLPRNVICDGGEQGRAHDLEAWLDEHIVQRLLELCPALFLVTHPDQDPDQHGRHVLQHDALWHHGAAGKHWDDERDDDIRENQQQGRLPERVFEVRSHLWLARNCTSASNCAAVSWFPNVFGMMPLNFSNPLAIFASGVRIDSRIRFAESREPTWLRSGPIAPPSPLIL